jgi:hypothetical protein
MAMRLGLELGTIATLIASSTKSRIERYHPIDGPQVAVKVLVEFDPKNDVVGPLVWECPTDPL